MVECFIKAAMFQKAEQKQTAKGDMRYKLHFACVGGDTVVISTGEIPTKLGIKEGDLVSVNFTAKFQALAFDGRPYLIIDASQIKCEKLKVAA